MDAPLSAANVPEVLQVHNVVDDSDDDEMHVDAEGRPRFTPAKQAVSLELSICDLIVKLKVIGGIISCGEPQSSYPASPHVTTQSFVVQDISTACGTSEITSANEHQESCCRASNIETNH